MTAHDGQHGAQAFDGSKGILHEVWNAICRCGTVQHGQPGISVFVPMLRLVVMISMWLQYPPAKTTGCNHNHFEYRVKVVLHGLYSWDNELKTGNAESRRYVHVVIDVLRS